ncbi:hypothetical protein SFC66_10700 [Terribacillus saccharophilus]|uniref:hypothetical protein n=1 Tax=Terribacillus saccharophilus TaxID=361277 RepID=UPI0039822CFC
MAMLPLGALIGALCLFAIIFFCIRWLVQRQWYSVLSVLSAHVFLGYVLHAGWLEAETLGRGLLLTMTLICCMLVLLKSIVIFRSKK